MSETLSAPAETNDIVPETNGYDETLKALDLDPADMEADADESGEDAPEEDDSEKISLKVNGKTEKKTLNEVIELAQKYQATEMKLEVAKKEITEARKMQEGIKEQQQAVKNLLGVLQRGDLETISEFVDTKLNAGAVFNKAIIQYALKLYEYEKMSPEQREHLENKKQVARYKQEAEDRQKQDAQREYQYKVNQYQEQIATEVPKALKEVGLPDTDFTREQLVSTWRAAIERGQTPTATAVAAFVKKRLEESKINFGQTKPAIPAVPQRPKATPKSVGMKTEPAETGYVAWDSWLKTRGK